MQLQYHNPRAKGKETATAKIQLKCQFTCLFFFFKKEFGRVVCHLAKECFWPMTSPMLSSGPLLVFSSSLYPQ